MKGTHTSERTILPNSWLNNQIIIQINGEKSVQRAVKMMQQKNRTEKSKKIFTKFVVAFTFMEGRQLFLSHLPIKAPIAVIKRKKSLKL